MSPLSNIFYDTPMAENAMTLLQSGNTCIRVGSKNTENTGQELPGNTVQEIT
jgi:hypothetical protein